MQKKEFDVLVVGELNIDLILDDMESFPEIGKEKLARQMTYTLGGSSAIFASNLSSLGARVAFKGKVGTDDFGEKVLLDLQENGVTANLMVQDPTQQTGITVVINAGEDRAMLTYPGAMEALSADEVTEEDLKKARHLHVSSLFLQPGLKKDITALFRRAKDMGMTTSLDPQWDPAELWDVDLALLLEYLDIFLPNEQEFLHLTGSERIEDGIEGLARGESVIVVKQSNRGATLFHNDKKIHRSAVLNPEPIDAIGAGDSFDAGFICQFVQGEELEKCLEFGNLVGAVSTTASGGTAAITGYQQVIETATKTLGYKAK